jgi:hypothetical protein
MKTMNVLVALGVGFCFSGLPAALATAAEGVPLGDPLRPVIPDDFNKQPDPGCHDDDENPDANPSAPVVRPPPRKIHDREGQTPGHFPPPVEVVPPSGGPN